MVAAVVGVLAHLRGHPAAAAGGTDVAAVARRSSRVGLFARFLGGLRLDGVEPIPTEGLGVYLAALARAQVRIACH